MCGVLVRLGASVCSLVNDSCVQAWGRNETARNADYARLIPTVHTKNTAALNESAQQNSSLGYGTLMVNMFAIQLESPARKSFIMYGSCGTVGHFTQLSKAQSKVAHVLKKVSTVTVVLSVVTSVKG